MTRPHASSGSSLAADSSDLPLPVFEPDSTPWAAIVVFHGGALRNGSVDDLVPHAARLASHGILAASAGYRLLGHGAEGIDVCLADVRRAVTGFAAMAAARGVGSDRMATGGSSAGAHLALLAALTATRAPAAVVGWNPAGLDLSRLDQEQQRRLEREVGIDEGGLLAYSVVEFVHPDGPAVSIHHGTHDEIAPIEDVRRFRDVMVRAGNTCVLQEYERATHGFHHHDAFHAVVDRTAGFLRQTLLPRSEADG